MPSGFDGSMNLDQHQYDDQPDLGAVEEQLSVLPDSVDLGEQESLPNQERELSAEELLIQSGMTRDALLQRAVDHLKSKSGKAKTTPFPLRDTRALVRIALMSGHQSGYAGAPQVDKVDERREQERQQISERIKAQLLLLNETDTTEETKPREPMRPTRSEVRLIAAELGTNPARIRMPRHVATLKASEKFNLLKKCREIASKRAHVGYDADGKLAYLVPDMAEIWNQQVFGLVEVNTESGKKSYRRDQRTGMAIPRPFVMQYNEWSRELYGVQSVYRDPGAPVQPALHGIAMHQKPSNGLKESKEWMDAAAQHQQLLVNCKVCKGSGKGANEVNCVVCSGSGKTPVQTKCWLTGDSLIVSRTTHSDQSLKEKAAKKEEIKFPPAMTKWLEEQAKLNPPEKKPEEWLHHTWKIGPNLKGMGLKGAREIVDHIAKLTFPLDVLQEAYHDQEIVGLSLDGEIPVFYKKIIDEPDAWAILAAHTKHPVWGKVAEAMLAWRDSLYFKLNEKEIRSSRRIGSMVFEKLCEAYPEVLEGVK